MIKLKPESLRTTLPSSEQLEQIKKNPLFIIVDNVLDTYNIGAIFRLADAVAAKKVFLCGQSETPPHTRIKKASINTTEWVEWEYEKDPVTVIKKLRETYEHIKIVSIEQDKRSISYDTFAYTFPLALVVGHETDGVSKEVRDLSDAIVEIPLWGVNVSLNVMVSLGIVVYKAMEYLEKNT